MLYAFFHFVAYLFCEAKEQNSKQNNSKTLNRFLLVVLELAKKKTRVQSNLYCHNKANKRKISPKLENFYFSLFPG